jgi:hypothetical protein
LGKGELCKSESHLFVKEEGEEGEVLIVPIIRDYGIFQTNMILQSPTMFQNPQLMYKTALNRVLDFFPLQVSDFLLKSSYGKLRMFLTIVSSHMMYDNAVGLLRVLANTCVHSLLSPDKVTEIQLRISSFAHQSQDLYFFGNKLVLTSADHDLFDRSGNSENFCQVVYHKTVSDGFLSVSLRLNEAAEQFIGYSTEEFIEYCVIRDRQFPSNIPAGLIPMSATFL